MQKTPQGNLEANLSEPKNILICLSFLLNASVLGVEFQHLETWLLFLVPDHIVHKGRMNGSRAC